MQLDLSWVRRDIGGEYKLLGCGRRVSDERGRENHPYQLQSDWIGMCLRLGAAACSTSE